jgi:hypothetical protein
MGRKAIQIPQGDQPLLTFDVPSGGVTGSTIAFFAKVNEAQADGSAIANIAGVVVNDTQFTVQISSAVTPNAGILFYKVVLTKSSKPVTRQWGPLEIVDV